jgi:hypothetical protein
VPQEPNRPQHWPFAPIPFGQHTPCELICEGLQQAEVLAPVGMQVVSDPQHWVPPQGVWPDEQQSATCPEVERFRQLSPDSQQAPIGLVA